MHHAGKNGVLAQRGAELVEIEQAIGLGVEIGDLETLALELATTVEYRL